MDPKSKSYLELQRKWYARLRAKGFDDIEQEDGKLKSWAVRQSANDKIAGLREAKEEYYRLAGQFAYDYNFATTADKLSWLKHSEGMSIKNIVVFLKKKGLKANKGSVHATLQRLKAIMLKGLNNGQE